MTGITLRADDGDTIMTVRHSGIPVAHAAEHRDGWVRFLPQFVAAIQRHKC